MPVEDEIKGLSRFLFGWLGFPLGLIAIIGAFSLGVAIYRDEVSLSGKRLILGAFLLSFSAFAYHLPNIYTSNFFDGEKWLWHFSLKSLVWALVFGVATYFSGRTLVHLMMQ